MPRKPTHRKPTQTFGHIAFGKDGTVRDEFARLSDEKDKQEHDVLRWFPKYGSDLLPEGATITPLEENDHDGEIRLGNGSRYAVVQLTELVRSDVSIEITEAEWHSGVYRCSTPIYTRDARGRMRPEGYLAFLPEKLSGAIAGKIKKKLDKRYAKPTNANFWLIVFTVDPYVQGLGSGWEGGVWKESEMAKGARLFVEQRSGSEPFDRIFYFAVGLRPEQIWPVLPRIVT